jgi:DNA-binding response OmpR family regulator/thioredoxin-like negative regulator of GroEL
MSTIKELLEQLRRNPGRPDIHNTLGRLYHQRNEDTEAIKHFLAAARLFSGVNSPSRNVNKAVVVLRKMIRDFPSHHDSYYILAEILQEMDHQEEAVDVYRTLSDLYKIEGKHLMAVSVFDKVIAADPDDQDNWIRFANLNREAGMPFHAAQAMLKAASIGLEKRKGEPPATLTVEALKLDPENSEAQELFRNLSRQGKTGEKQESDVLTLADEMDKNGQYEQALALLDLLDETTLKYRARKAAERIRGYSGTEEGTQEEDVMLLERPSSGKFSGTKILVVDDEHEILLLLEQILSGEGFNVLTADDGEKGLEVYLSERPPLVVSDAMLPKLHGFELCRRIKEESENTARVMILTAVYKKYKYKGKVQEEYNVDEYLDKPFQITEFLQVLYKMAEGLPEAKQEVPHAGEETGPEDLQEDLSIVLAVSEDREVASKVTAYCERNGISFSKVSDSREFLEVMEKEIPDILLFLDPFKGLGSEIAARLVRTFMDNQWTTLVMATRDRSRMEGELNMFDHRIIAPFDSSVLDNVVNLHRSSHRIAGSLRQRVGTLDERRIEAVVKSKVERVLKSHNQLEEYYSSKVRELEYEIGSLKEELEKRGPGGE